MSSDDLTEMYVHTLIVETFEGTNGYGEDLFSAPFTVEPPTGCFIEPKRRLVRASDGEQVVSETTIYTDTAHAARFVPGSRVTIEGTAATVITAANLTSGDLDLPDHIVINLDRGSSRS